MAKKSVLILLMLGVSFTVFLIPNAHALFSNLSTIETPNLLQTLDNYPVAVEVIFRKKVQTSSFKVWLNGKNVTQKFQVSASGATAVLGLEDGLQFRTEDQRPRLQATNVLKTYVKKSRWKVDIDYCVFFVVVPNQENSSPTADAGEDQTVFVGETVLLDGSGSTDPDGDSLTFSWSLFKPLNSQAQLSDPAAIQPEFTVDLKGTYIAELVVNDGFLDSDPDEIIISTENSPPEARIVFYPEGPYHMDDDVAIDGLGSTDPDGDELSYLWALKQLPSGSASQLEIDTGDAALCHLTPDTPGDYIIELVVNDGEYDSDPATATLTTENNPPVADISGPTDPLEPNESAMLDGSGSYDLDQDELTYTWALTAKPGGSEALLEPIIPSDPTLQSLTPDLAGDYLAQLTVNDGFADSDPATLMVSRLAEVPDVVGLAQADAESVILAAGLDVGEITSLLSSSVPSGQVISQEPDAGLLVQANTTIDLVISSGPVVVSVPDVVGQTQAVAESAIDSAGLTVGIVTTVSSDTVPAGSVISQEPVAGVLVPENTAIDLVISSGPVMVSVPDVVGQTQEVAENTISSAGLAVGTVTTASSDTVPSGCVISQDPSSGESIVAGLAVNLVVSTGPASNLPPDPVDVAPNLASAISTTVFSATEFLYTGQDPIQTGVAADTIDKERVSVLRGRVLNRDGSPLSGVTITIHSYSEFGQTLTRSDGMFDLAINGGGVLTVSYEKNGYLPAHRQTQVPWHQYVWLPNVVLVPLDTAATTVDLSAVDPIQVARGSVSTDDDGSRQASLFIPQGTEASIVMPDGSSQTLTAMTLRLTEYTLGDSGPEAMPAQLPPTSAYTYCLELSADEALAAGAQSVRFSQPLPFYVENFLGFPTGAVAPVGYYDFDAEAWVPSDNGRVIEILSISDGTAAIDLDGDGAAEDATTLAAFGISSAEQTQLASLYTAGQSLWRITVDHFTPWDVNWPRVSVSDDAIVPSGSVLNTIFPWLSGSSSTATGFGTVGIEDQSFRESVSVAGTPFSLAYSSDRVPGRQEKNAYRIALSGDTIPDSLKQIKLRISIAGQLHEQSFQPTANLYYDFQWDGQDAYGRMVGGSQNATVEIGYVYDATYATPVEGQRSFGYGSGVPFTQVRAREEAILWQVQTVNFSSPATWFAMDQGIAGWTLDVHHAYDVTGRMLYRGDGTSVKAFDIGKVVQRIAGKGDDGFSGDGGAAIDAEIDWNPEVAVGPDGTIYFSDPGNHRIRKIDPQGIITSIAGSGEITDWCGGYDEDENGWIVTDRSIPVNGDGGPAVDALLCNPTGIDLGPDGSVYFIDSYSRVRKIDPQGIITTVAGGVGDPGYAGDGIPATEAVFDTPSGVAVGPDGSVYISDRRNDRVQKVGPDGIIQTVAGNGSPGFSGDGGPATAAQLQWPAEIAVGPDGSLYIGEVSNYRVRRVGPDGIITTFAGNGVRSGIGDGMPATDASVYPSDIHVASDGIVYIGQNLTEIPANGAVRRVGPDGIITTIVGSGDILIESDEADGNPATAIRMYGPSISAMPNGELIFGTRATINRVASAAAANQEIGDSELLIPSEDGKWIYRFDGNGRHLNTLHGLTGATMLSFGYDSSNRLITITDSDGNITTIERDQDGTPLAVVAPFGQRTALNTDANGYLAAITNPAAETIGLTYTSKGLLTQVTSAKGGNYEMAYDDMGLLQSAEDPEGGSAVLTRTDDQEGYTVALTTAEGVTSAHQVQETATGDRQRTVVSSDNTQRTVGMSSDASSTGALPDGSTITFAEAPDPRFGMQAPITNTVTVATQYNGATLETNVTTERVVTLTDTSDITQVASQTDTTSFNGKTYRSVFDRSSLTFTHTTPEGRVASTTIDDVGRIVESRFAAFAARDYTYNSKGQLSSVTQSGGADSRQMTFAYDASGYISTITDNRGRSASFEYDTAGRITRQLLPGSREIAYQYDVNGNLTDLTPPGQPAHTFGYNTVDVLVSYTPPDIGDGLMSTTFTYNHDRQLTEIQRPDGQVITREYDTAGRLSTISSQAAGELKRFAYDSATGKLTGIDNNDSIGLGYTFDGSLLTDISMTGAVTGSLACYYNNNLQITQVDVNADAGSIYYTYDNDGLVTGVGYDQTDNMLAITRDPDHGLITTTQFGNMVADSRQYNDFGEMDSYSATCNGSACFSVDYTFDAIGRIEEKSETIDGVTAVYRYVYDDAGQLTEVRDGDNALVSSYTYDANGNRLTGPGITASAVYDAQDRLLEYGDQTFTYTHHGDLQTKTDPSGTTTYTYDVFGSLKTVEKADGTTVTYLVDGQNRRVGKTVDGTFVKGFMYANGLSPLAELDGSNTVVSLFFYGSRSNVPDLMVKAGIPYRILTDHLGSVRLVVNAQDGSVVQRMDFDEFGLLLNDTNPGFQPFGFAGGLYDPDTGLTRFGARDYDPAVGRWTAKDPILFASGGTNLYGYVLNEPINYNDPSGLGPSEGPLDDSLYLAAGSMIPPFDPSLPGPWNTLNATPSNPFSKMSQGMIENEVAPKVFKEATEEIIEESVKEIEKKVPQNVPRATSWAQKAFSTARYLGRLWGLRIGTVLGGECILTSIYMQEHPEEFHSYIMGNGQAYGEQI